MEYGRGWAEVRGAAARCVSWPRILCVGFIEQVSSRWRAQTWWCSEHDQVRYLHNLVSLSKAAGISWKGVLVIHIIMGRGRPKGVKDSRPIKVNITQKSKHNNGGNGVTAAAYGERSTTALTFNEQRERGMLPRAALHQKNVISNEQLNRHSAEAGQIAPIFSSLYFLFSLSTWSTLACAFVITHSLRIFAYLSFSLWSWLLECEVNNVYTQQTRHHAHKDGAVENVVKSSK